MTADAPPPLPAAHRAGRRELVLLFAALMASNAMAIDMILPALPAIGEALEVADENRRQLVITVYMLGFGAAQLIYGPLADRFGRKPILIGCMVLYAAVAALCGLAGSFVLLLIARTLHGVAAAGSRVLVVAVVRDRFKGAAIAQVMSTVMMTFFIVPVIAPSLGQALLSVGTWRYIFLALAAYGLVLAMWSALRLSETLARAAQRPLTAGHFGAAAADTLTRRASIGNTAVVTMIMGALFGFINSFQQIIFDVFGRPELIGLAFACVATVQGLSAYANARLVMRFGSRRLLVIALGMFTTFALVHLAVILTIGETIWMFVAFQALTFSSFGLIGSNAGALAMEPLGAIAGTASAVQGVLTTVGGALIGLVIGQLFDGTTVPLIAGFVVCGALALLFASWANAGLPAHSPDEVALH